MSHDEDAAASGGRRSSSSSSRSTPLWKFVRKVEKIGGNGGNWEFECSFCGARFKGSYSRVKAHLLRIPNQGIKICDKAPTNDRSRLRRMHRDSIILSPSPLPSLEQQSPSLEHQKQKKKRRASLPIATPLAAAAPPPPIAANHTDPDPDPDQNNKDSLDSLIARSFFSHGLSFNLARNPFFRDAFSFAAAHHLPSYTPPTYHDLLTTLLDREKAALHALFDPVRFKWAEKGLTLVSHGWALLHSRPLINFFAVSDSVPIFLRAVNCDPLLTDSHQAASILRSVILEVGEANVVQLITDNMPLCQSAAALIQQEFPNIYWSPCVVHALDLALNDISATDNTQLNHLSAVIRDVFLIRDFLLTQPMRDNLFNKLPSFKLLTIAESRFASYVVLLRRFKDIKASLLAMLMDDDAWSSYIQGDADKVKYVKEKIGSDEWWDFVDFIISFTEPIYDMMRMCDTVDSTLHLVCHYWDDMMVKVRASMFRHEKVCVYDIPTLYNTVHSIIDSRWAKSYAPLHCLAHSLNPRYYSKEWLEGGEGRVAPHRDATISKERDNCLKRYFPDPEARYSVISQFGDFAGCAGDFASFDSQSARGRMDARKWWVVYGVGAPQLQSLALKLLGQPTSSSCCEKNWGTFSFIQSLDKNPMDPKRALDLVFVHNNLRLLSRRSPQYNQGETKMWDIAGDAFDLSEKGLMEMANLSLDEPEMERAFFMDGLGDADRVLMLA